jgi:hypothetical protein
MEILTVGSIVNITTMHIGPHTQAYFFLREAGGTQQEAFILWAVPDGEVEWAPRWIERSINVSMLQHALVNNIQVGVWHEDTSAQADAVEIGPFMF